MGKVKQHFHNQIEAGQRDAQSSQRKAPKEHPILFSGPMVQAIMEERKTQTRRIFKDHPRLASDVNKVDLKQWLKDYPELILNYCPYGKPGDLLWVREAFNYSSKNDLSENEIHIEALGSHIVFRASSPTEHPDRGKSKWKPSIHMPKAAARIWLEVEETTVERLQEISRDDCLKEGLDIHGAQFKDYVNNTLTYNERISFRSLWQSINGKDSWKKNPWIWVVTFKVLSTTGKPE